MGKVCKRTSNIRWKETTRAYRYIDLTSVSRDNHSISETMQITSEDAPSRAQKLVEEDDVIFATTRPTLQRFAIIDEDYHGEVASSGYCVLRADKNKVLPKWLYFNLSTTTFYSHVEKCQEGSAYPAISDAKVKEFKIALPSLEEQARIIALLDKFDTLANSISEGLPREIELRRKQYAYYRDLLFNFPQQEAVA